MSATTTPAGAVPTIAMLVSERARRAPDAVAVRWKRHGIWCEVTWAQYRDEVRDTARMLRDLGVGAGDRVAVLADNRYQWLLTDVATVALHGLTVALDPTAEPDAVAAALSGAAVTVVVAEDDEQIDKVLAAGEIAGLGTSCTSTTAASAAGTRMRGYAIGTRRSPTPEPAPTTAGAERPPTPWRTCRTGWRQTPW